MNSSLIDIDDDGSREDTINVNANEFNQLKDQMAELVRTCALLRGQLHETSDTVPLERDKCETFKVTTKLPIFYSEKPDLWFYQIESQFRNNGIVRDQTKFDIIVSSLDPKYLDVVAEIIRNPPICDKYNAIKTALIKEFQYSEETRLKQLLLGMDLGDQKPSVLLRKMRETAKGIFADNILETLWASKLPQVISAIIVGTETSLNQKADTADRIQDRIKFDNVSAVSKKSNVSENQSDLGAQIASLSKQIEEMGKQFGKFSRSRSRSRSRNRNSDEKSSNEKKYDQCWYHFKFGPDAKKCTDWCKLNNEFKEKN